MNRVTINRISIFFLVLGLMMSFQSYATDVSGNLIDDDTWTAANSPYNIIGDVGVPGEYTLTIEAGVTINYTGDFNVLVFGVLNVNGTEANPVIFNGNSEVATEYMLEIRRTNLDNSNIDYAEMNGPQGAIIQGKSTDVTKNTGVLNITGSTINNSLLLTDLSADNPATAAPAMRFTSSVIDDTPVFGAVISSYDTGYPLQFVNSQLTNLALEGINVSFESCENRDLSFNSIDSINSSNSKILNASFTSINTIILTHSKIIESPMVANTVTIDNSIFVLSLTSNATLLELASSGSTINNSSFTGLSSNVGMKLTNSASSVVVNNAAFVDLGVGINVTKGALVIGSSNFLRSRNYHIENLSESNITATNNYWDSDSPTIIATKIYDQVDDLELGKVDLTGYLSTPNIDAPISLPQTVVKSEDGAGGLNITWKASPEADVAGFKVYWGAFTGYSFENSADVGNVLTYNIAGLSISDSVSVTAYDDLADGSADQVEGQESWFSFAKNVETDFLSFSFEEQITDAIIDVANHTIAIDIGNITSPTSLIASFDLSYGSTAIIDDLIQESTVTSNDFTNPVTYTVIAEDGVTTQDWEVTVIEINTETDFTSFSFSEQITNATINATDHIIAVDIPDTTSPTNLIASFELSYGSTVSIDEVIQESGITSNDFTNPVTYTVTAEDGVTTQDWVATVTVLNTETDFTSFSFEEQTEDATINTTDHTITIEVDYLTDPASLIASFTLSNGATVTIEDDIQKGGVTSNDFTNSVTYRVTAEDGVTIENWIITVTIQSYPAPSITSFTPSSAVATTKITINGTAFIGATGVAFGGTVANSFTVVSASVITAVVGAGTSGEVSVTTPGGTATLGGFNFITQSIAILSERRSHLSATSVGDKAFFAGGYISGNSYSKVVDIYDNSTNTWSTTTLSEARRYLTASSVGDKAFFAGGYNGSYSDVVDIYDSSTNTWSTATLSQARGWFSSTSVGNKAFFAGGSAKGGYLSDIVDIYDNSTDTWSTATLSGARYRLSATSVGDKVFFAGGYISGGDSDLVDIYDNSTDTWSTATLSEARGYLTASSVGDKAFFAGGSAKGGYSDLVDIYDNSTNTWSTSTLSERRSNLSATSVGDKVFFAGGYNGSYSDVVDIYDNSTDTWSTTSLSNKRDFLSATSVGDKVFFAGGENNSGYAQTIDIYALPTALTISSFSPASVATNATVTITGANFTAVTAVSFGGTAAASFTVVSATTITAVVGLGASGSVSVTGLGGSDTRSGFTFIVPPTITSFSPANGPIGTEVIITGTNFDANPANNIVYFGATRATVLAASATELIVSVPAGATYEPITVLVDGLIVYSLVPFVVTFEGGGTIDENSFSVQESLSTGGVPRSIVSGDLDNDGAVDLAGANFEEATLSLFKNTSNGSETISFASKEDQAAGSDPKGIIKSDLDGDGLLDLVVANESSNTISVYRNTSINSILSYDEKIDFPTDERPYAIAAGDFDQDGRIDLAVVNIAVKSVSIFKNTTVNEGLITFDSRLDFSTGAVPTAVVVGDLDGDHKVDIAVTNFNDNTVSVLINKTVGSIEFESKVDFTTGSDPFSVTLGDLDFDNRLDLVIANYDENTISLFKNTTNGVVDFADRMNLTAGLNPNSASIGDLNGDGLLDIATVNRAAMELMIYENLGATQEFVSYGSPVSYATSGNPRIALIGDLNADGVSDLAIANASSNSITIYKNTSEPILSSLAQFTSFAIASQIGSADLNLSNQTITLSISADSDLTSIIPTFTISNGASAKVDNLVQVSGTTPNDFTNPVTYTVTAADGSTTQDWVVTVTVEKSTETEITSFSIQEETSASSINASNQTIDIEVAFGTNVTSLIPTFTLSEGASTAVNSITQTSATTANDFTNPVTYTVTAEDGSTIQDWVVTVTIEKSTETEITSFSIQEETNASSINASNHAIDLEVTFETDVTSLIPTFTLSSGATAKVENVAQVSGTTPNDFSQPVVYKVTSEDGVTIQDWTVTVAVDGAPTFSSINYNQTYTIGSGGLTVSASIDSDNALSSVIIYYKELTASAYSQSAMSLVGNQYTYSWGEEDFDRLGLTFYLSVEDINSNLVLSDNQTIITISEDDAESIPGLMSSIDPLDYAIISMPYQTSAVADVFSALGSNEDGSWKLSHHDGSEQYQYYPADFTQFEPGKGYWFLSSKVTGFLLKGGTAVSVSDDDPFTIQLRANDWNMIGNPFPYPINWQSIIDHNANNAVTIERLVTFKNRQYNAGELALNKYDGALLFSSSNAELEIPLSAISSTGGRVTSVSNRNSIDGFDTGDWEIGLNLFSDELAYNVSGIAMKPDASIGRDAYDWPMLPRLGSYLDLSFEQGITKSVVASADSYTWDFTVNSHRKGESIQLSWESLDLSDYNHSLSLLDIENQTIIDMGERSHYEFNQSSESKAFKILYGPKGAPEYLDFGYSFVGNPFPNPFNRDLTVPISIIEPDAVVKVTIYNILGKKVYQLEQSNINEGYHHFLLKLSEEPLISEHSGTYILNVFIQSENGVSQVNKRIIFNR